MGALLLRQDGDEAQDKEEKGVGMGIHNATPGRLWDHRLVMGGD